MPEINDINNMIITHISHIFYDRFENVKKQKHFRRLNNGIYFVIDGKAEFKFADNVILLKSGEGVILPSNSEYTYSRKSSSTIFIINFSLLNSEDFREPILFSPEDPSSLLPYFSTLKALKTTPFLKLSPELFSAAYSLLSRIAGSSKKKLDPALSEAIKFINESFSNPHIRLFDIAAKSHYSIVHFRRIFKESYGVSPMQYLNRLRIEVAEAKLIESDASIEQIAEACGFDNVYYFSRFFKIKTGSSPSSYRKAFKII